MRKRSPHVHHQPGPRPYGFQRADPTRLAEVGVQTRRRRGRRCRHRHHHGRRTRGGGRVSIADRTGTGIPIGAFAELTLIFSLIGVCFAAVVARRARRPRAMFTRTALTLTTLSFIPDLTFGFDAASAATLIALHSVAAAMVIPTLVRRLADTR
jgi:Family of unknown function (DUF6069)